MRREYEEKSAAQEDRHNRERLQQIEKQEAQNSHSRDEIARVKQRHAFEMQRTRRLHKQAMDERERQHGEIHKDMRNEHEYSIKQNQRKYSEALGKERERLDAIRDKVYGDSSRTARQREVQNQKIRDQQMANDKDRIRRDRQNRRQIENMQRQHGLVVDTMFEERQGMVKEFNTINREEIGLANKRADDRIQQNYDYMREKVGEMDDKYIIEIWASQRHELIRENNEKVEKNRLVNENLKQENYHERLRIEQTHKNQVSRLKDHHYNLLDQERFQNTENRKQLRSEFEQKIKKIDLQYRKKVGQLNSDHQKQILSLQDRHQQEINKIKRENERVAVEKERAVKFREGNKEAQTEYRMKKIREAHNEELRILNAQYRENLRNLVRDRDIS